MGQIFSLSLFVSRKEDIFVRSGNTPRFNRGIRTQRTCKHGNCVSSFTHAHANVPTSSSKMIPSCVSLLHTHTHRYTHTYTHRHKHTHTHTQTHRLHSCTPQLLFVSVHMSVCASWSFGTHKPWHRSTFCVVRPPVPKEPTQNQKTQVTKQVTGQSNEVMNRSK